MNDSLQPFDIHIARLHPSRVRHARYESFGHANAVAALLNGQIEVAWSLDAVRAHDACDLRIAEPAETDQLTAAIERCKRVMISGTGWEALRAVIDAASELQQVRADRDALARGVRVSIPTATMEQEFAAHHRRGRESMQAERDAVIKERDKLQKALREQIRNNEDQADMIYVITKERDSYKQDAERWRWMRSNTGGIGDDLDSAIDAALSAQKAGGQP